MPLRGLGRKAVKPRARSLVDDEAEEASSEEEEEEEDEDMEGEAGTTGWGWCTQLQQPAGERQRWVAWCWERLISLDSERQFLW